MYKNIYRFLKALLFCTFFAAQTNVLLATPVYNQTILGELPAGFSLPGKGQAINFSGNLAGALFQNSKNQAAVLSLPNSINIISGLGGDFSFGTDINELNQVTGYYNVVPNTGQLHAYFWDGNTVTDLGTLGGANSSSLDLSENGLITGESLTAQGDRHAFLWNGNNMIDVNGSATSSGGRGVSENGLVTGWAKFNSNNHHAFLWDGNQTIDLGILPNGLTSAGNAVNAQGHVTGPSRLNTGSSHAFFWDGQVMNDLGTLGGGGSNGKDINELNYITGWADTGRQNSEQHAFVWLGDELIDLDPNDVFKFSAGWNIDNDGNVVGMASDSDGSSFYLVEWKTIDIKANGSDRPITVETSDTLSVKVSLVAGSRSGKDADWWVAADTPFGWYYFDVGIMNWAYAGSSSANLSVTYQGTLFDLCPPFEVLNMSDLPEGAYTFYFAVDTIMNGSLEDLGQLYYDSVDVMVQDGAVDLSGTWNASYTINGTPATLNMILNQTSATSLTGTWNSSLGGNGTLSGTISGSTVSFVLIQTNPGCSGRFNVSGTLTTNTKIDGNFSGSNCIESGTGTFTADKL